MASTKFNEWKDALFEAYISGKTIDAALVMSNTTCDTENDGIVNVADITTLDECDDTGYTRGQLASVVSNKDDTNDRAELDAADEVWSGLAGDATRQVVGVLLINRVDGTAANDIVIAYVEFTSAVTLGSGSFTIPWDAEGIIQLS